MRNLTLNNQRAAGRVRLAHPVVGRAEVAARVRPGHAGDGEAGVGRAGGVRAGRQPGVGSGPDHGGPGGAGDLALQHHLLPLRHNHLQHRLHTGGHCNNQTVTSPGNKKLFSFIQIINSRPSRTLDLPARNMTQT